MGDIRGALFLRNLAHSLFNLQLSPLRLRNEYLRRHLQRYLLMSYFEVDSSEASLDEEYRVEWRIVPEDKDQPQPAPAHTLDALCYLSHSNRLHGHYPILLPLSEDGLEG